MTRAIVNTVANFGGLAVTLVAGLFFAIFYFRVLGPESYGLVGLAITLVQFGTYFADMGIGRVLVRELARNFNAPNFAKRMRDTLFTFQITHLGLACLVGFAIALGSHWLAKHWLQLGSFPAIDASHAIAMMGLLAALQLPRAIAAEALRGLQKLVLSNLLMSSFALFRGFMTIAALFTFSRTVAVYLEAQIVASFIETATMTAVAWRFIPASSGWPRFRFNIIRQTWAFGAADGSAVIISAAMMLGDKILLSRLLPLETYGSYVFCVSLADIVARASGPFNSAFFPHFVNLVASGDESRLSRDYLGVTQMVSALLIPAAMVLALFSPEIIQLLLHNPETAHLFAPVLALRALGNLSNCLLHMPYSLQLATGLSSLFLKLNLLNITLYLPSILLLTPRFGVIVAPTLWLLVNLLDTIPMIIATHRRILRHDTWKWVSGSVARPIIIALVVVVVSRALAPTAVSWWTTFPWLAGTAALTAATIIISSSRTRNAGLRLFQLQFASKVMP